MYKKQACALLCSAFFLFGCDHKSLSDEEQPPLVANSRVVFDPSESNIDLPNNILFSESQDGTLNIPVEDSTNYSDPAVALSALDGWSTQQAFLINFFVDSQISGLSEASLAEPNSVRLYHVKMGSSDPSNACFGVEISHVCEIVSELQKGTDGDFIVKLSKRDQITVVPLKPLLAGESYLLQLTSSLKDSQGRAVRTSSSYQSLQQDIDDKPLATDEQLSLQALVNASERALQAYSVNTDTTIYTATLTTQSQTVLASIKQLMAQSANEQPQLSTPQYSGFDVKTALNPELDSCPDLMQKVATNSANASELMYVGFCNSELYYAQLDLPYYSGISTVNEPNAAKGDGAWWHARCDSPVVLAQWAAIGNQIPASAQSENDGYCMAFGLRDLGLDSQRHLTQYNPLVEPRGLQTVNVQVTVPNIQVINAMNAQAESQLSMPDEGWPVVILMHGVTSKKEDMLALTAALSMAGYASVAIDLPLHGERGFDTDDDGIIDLVTTDEDASAFMNLANLRATRDNLRQANADLLQLRLALALQNATFNGHKLNSDKVSLIGHSLGGIVGGSFTAIANSNNDAQLDALFKIDSAVLSNAAGGIASLIVESTAFGNFIQGTIVLAAFESFNDYLTAHQQSFAQLMLDSDAYQIQKQAYIEAAGLDEKDIARLELAQSYVFYLIDQGKNLSALTGADHDAVFPTLLAGLNSQQSVVLDTLVSEFVYVAQSVIDAGDPVNYASQLRASQTPILVTEIWGNGTRDTWDQVIPPLVAMSPLSGTEAYARLLNAETRLQSGDAANNVLVKFNCGSHESLLSPLADPNVTQVMQNLVMTWVASQGSQVSISDPSVVID